MEILVVFNMNCVLSFFVFLQFRRKSAVTVAKSKGGMKILARILLRKELGRDPTLQETQEAQEYRRAKCKEIALEEIIEAYFCGSEVWSLFSTSCSSC